MNKLWVATIIFFASYAGTVFAIIFLFYKMFFEALVAYGIGWLGWIIAFLIGGHELVEKRRKYRRIFKKIIKKLFRRPK